MARCTLLILVMVAPRVAGAKDTDVDAWLEMNDRAASDFGWSVSTAGDVNGDGFDDVIVGAPDYTVADSEGAAFAFYGSAAGVSTLSDWTVVSNQIEANLGWSVSDAGDVNGDGFDDVVVGALDYNHGEDQEGAAFVFLGSPTGLDTTPAWMAESNQVQAQFGSSVSGAGDVNADGFDDLLIGANLYDDGQDEEGAAFLYLGSSAGPSLAPDWHVGSDVESGFMGEYTSIASAGDVNGDGFDDVIVGARNVPTDGIAWIFLGSATGLDVVPSWEVLAPLGAVGGSDFGTSVSTAGDVNGDGFDDVVVGAPEALDRAGEAGLALVFLGGPLGVSETPAWRAAADEVDSLFGGPGFAHAVSSAGDLNGDGFADIVVGAWAYDHGEADEGVAFLYRGSAAGLQRHPRLVVESNLAESRFGFSVSSAGDLNGDGFDDVVVGADSYTTFGAVGVIYGK